MEVDKEGTTRLGDGKVMINKTTDQPPEAGKEASSVPQPNEAEGSSPCISWPLPPWLAQGSEAVLDDQMFFNLLGVCTDIVGFSENGDVVLAFD